MSSTVGGMQPVPSSCRATSWSASRPLALLIPLLTHDAAVLRPEPGHAVLLLLHRTVGYCVPAQHLLLAYDTVPGSFDPRLGVSFPGRFGLGLFKAERCCFVQLKVLKDIVRHLVHSKEPGLDIIPSPDALKSVVEQQPGLLEHLAQLGVTTADWDQVCCGRDAAPLPSFSRGTRLQLRSLGV